MSGGRYVCVSAGDFIDESPPPIPNTCDRPPVPFVGRNVAVQEVSQAEGQHSPHTRPRMGAEACVFVCGVQVVSLLSLTSQGNRCITIRGKPGIGKTALASRVCQYIVSGSDRAACHDHRRSSIWQ